MASQIADAVALLQTDVDMNYKEAKEAFMKRHGFALNETTFYAAKRKVKAMGAGKPALAPHPTVTQTPVLASDAVAYLDRVDALANKCGGYEDLEVFVRTVMEMGGPEAVITVVDRIKKLR